MTTGSFSEVDPPRLRDNLSVSPLDDDLVIYDPASGESFILNQTGRLVWEYCDGERTIDDIAGELALTHGISNDQARTDVAELIGSFQRSGLLAE